MAELDKVTIVFDALVSDFIKNTEQVKQQLKDIAGEKPPQPVPPETIGSWERFSGAIKEHSAQFTHLGMVLGGVGAGITATFGLLTKSSGDLQYELTRVGAVLGATEGELEAVRSKAIEMGRDTIFTSKEAGEAMYYLASAGFKTNEVLDAIRGTLDLATASGRSAAEASTWAAEAIKVFGLEASETTRVADVYTKAIMSSALEMEHLADAMKFVGTYASIAGMSLEETVAVLAAISDTGIKGAMAGTALRAVLQALLTPTKEGTQALSELGVSVYTAEGKMRPFGDIVKDLQVAFGNLTTEQKANYESMLFTMRGTAGMEAIMKMGAERIGEYTAELQNASGASKEFSDKLMDTLPIAFKQVQASIAVLGEAFVGKLVPVITDMVYKFKDLIDILANFFEAHPTIAKVIAGLTAVAGIFGTVGGASLIFLGQLGSLLKTIEAFGGGLKILEALFLPVISGIKGLIGVIPALVTGIGAVYTALGPVGIAVGAVSAAVGALYLAWKTNFLGMRDVLEPFGKAVETVFGVVKDLFIKFIDFVKEHWRIFVALIPGGIPFMALLEGFKRFVDLFKSEDEKFISEYTNRQKSLQDKIKEIEDAANKARLAGNEELYKELLSMADKYRKEQEELEIKYAEVRRKMLIEEARTTIEQIAEKKVELRKKEEEFEAEQDEKRRMRIISDLEKLSEELTLLEKTKAEQIAEIRRLEILSEIEDNRKRNEDILAERKRYIEREVELRKLLGEETSVEVRSALEQELEIVRKKLEENEKLNITWKDKIYNIRLDSKNQIISIADSEGNELRNLDERTKKSLIEIASSLVGEKVGIKTSETKQVVDITQQGVEKVVEIEKKGGEKIVEIAKDTAEKKLGEFAKSHREIISKVGEISQSIVDIEKERLAERNKIIGDIEREYIREKERLVEEVKKLEIDKNKAIADNNIELVNILSKQIEEKNDKIISLEKAYSDNVIDINKGLGDRVKEIDREKNEVMVDKTKEVNNVLLDLVNNYKNERARIQNEIAEMDKRIAEAERLGVKEQADKLRGEREVLYAKLKELQSDFATVYTEAHKKVVDKLNAIEGDGAKELLAIVEGRNAKVIQLEIELEEAIAKEKEKFREEEEKRVENYNKKIYEINVDYSKRLQEKTREYQDEIKKIEEKYREDRVELLKKIKDIDEEIVKSRSILQSDYYKNLIREQEKFNVEMAELEKNHQDTISKLKSEFAKSIEELEKEKNKRIERENELHKLKLLDLESEQKSKIEAVIKERNNEIEKIEKNSKEKLLDIENRYKDDRKRISDEIVEIDKKIADAKKKGEEEIVKYLIASKEELNSKLLDLDKKYNEEVSSITDKRAKTIESIEKNSSEKITAIKEDYKVKSENITKDYNNTIIAINEDFKTRQLSIEQDYNSRILTEQKRFNEKREEIAEELRKIEEKIREAQLIGDEKTIKELLKRKESLNNQLLKLDDEYRKSVKKETEDFTTWKAKFEEDTQRKLYELYYNTQIEIQKERERHQADMRKLTEIFYEQMLRIMIDASEREMQVTRDAERKRTTAVQEGENALWNIVKVGEEARIEERRKAKTIHEIIDREIGLSSRSSWDTVMGAFKEGTEKSGNYLSNLTFTTTEETKKIRRAFNVLSDLPDWLEVIWGKVVSGAKNAWERVAAYVNAALAELAKLTKPGSSPKAGPLVGIDTWGEKLMQVYFDGMVKGMNVEGVRKELQNLADILKPGSSPKKGPLVGIDTWGSEMMEHFIDGLVEKTGMSRERIQELLREIKGDFARLFERPDDIFENIDTLIENIISKFKGLKLDVPVKIEEKKIEGKKVEEKKILKEEVKTITEKIGVKEEKVIKEKAPMIKEVIRKEEPKKLEVVKERYLEDVKKEFTDIPLWSETNFKKVVDGVNILDTLKDKLGSKLQVVADMLKPRSSPKIGPLVGIDVWGERLMQHFSDGMAKGIDTDKVMSKLWTIPTELRGMYEEYKKAVPLADISGKLLGPARITEVYEAERRRRERFMMEMKDKIGGFTTMIATPTHTTSQTIYNLNPSFNIKVDKITGYSDVKSLAKDLTMEMFYEVGRR